MVAAHTTHVVRWPLVGPRTLRADGRASGWRASQMSWMICATASGVDPWAAEGRASGLTSSQRFFSRARALLAAGGPPARNRAHLHDRERLAHRVKRADDAGVVVAAAAKPAPVVADELHVEVVAVGGVRGWGVWWGSVSGCFFDEAAPNAAATKKNKRAKKSSIISSKQHAASSIAQQKTHTHRTHVAGLVLRPCSLAIARSLMKKGAAPGGPLRHFWLPE